MSRVARPLIQLTTLAVCLMASGLVMADAYLDPALV